MRAKGGRWRNQPLTLGITHILEREREMAKDPDGWTFPSKTSKSGHIEKMSDPFARCVKRAEMEPELIIPHIMRHTAITRLAETGADLKPLQEFSGYKSLSMIIRYAHAQDRTVNLVLDRMEGGTVAEHPRARGRGKS